MMVPYLEQCVFCATLRGGHRTIMPSPMSARQLIQNASRWRQRNAPRVIQSFQYNRRYKKTATAAWGSCHVRIGQDFSAHTTGTSESYMYADDVHSFSVRSVAAPPCGQRSQQGDIPGSIRWLKTARYRLADQTIQRRHLYETSTTSHSGPYTRRWRRHHRQLQVLIQLIVARVGRGLWRTWKRSHSEIYITIETRMNYLNVHPYKAPSCYVTVDGWSSWFCARKTGANNIPN